MAIDISYIFKENVKKIRLDRDDGTSKTDILNEHLFRSNKSKKQKDDFNKEAKLIINNITILKKFLNENKKLYIQPNYLVASPNEVNEIDWQNFEDQAENIIRKCADAIQKLKENSLKQIYSTQHKLHLENVFYLLDKYLKDVCKVYSEQKAIRVKRLVEKKNLSQLCSTDLEKIFKNDSNQNLREEMEKNDKSNFKIENILSEQELLALEKENEQLYDNLTILSEEVRKVEGEVIEVAKLTQIFAENIVSQVTTVDQIQKSAIETNSNLELGNENIKEAMKKNAALRLWILFIIIVLSFTLLFLDWYND